MKMMKKVSALILALCMMLALIPNAAFAATGKATVNGIEYTTLTDALANCKSGEEVTISGTVEMMGNPGSSQVTDMKNVIITGVDETATIVFVNYTGSNSTGTGTFSNMTLKNLAVVDETFYTSENGENAWEFTYLELGGENNFVEVAFTDGIMVEGTSSTFTNCTFSGHNNDSSSYGTGTMYGVWVDEGAATFTNCVFEGTRGLKIHEDYGSEVPKVTVDGCTFDELSEKPGVVIGTLNAKTTIEIKNSKFNSMVPGDQSMYIYETDTDVTTFDFVLENNVFTCAVHTEEVDKAVAATCTETGLTEGKHCSVCKAVLVEQEVVKALGHTGVVDKAVAATCTETGLTEGKHCSVCKEVLVKQEEVKALGHTEELKDAKAATCTEKGYTGDKICTVCEETLEKGTEIAATGHKFVDGVCGACKLSIKVEAEVTDTVPSTSTEESTSGSASGTTEEKVEVPEVKEVTVVETTETKKAEASVKAEATEIVATTMTEGTDKLVEDKVIDKETAANLEAVTAVMNGDAEAVEKAVEEGLLTKEEVKAIEETVAKGEAVVKAEISVSEVKKEVVEKKVQAAMEEKAVKSVAKDAVVAQYLDVTVALKAVGKELGTVDKLETPITITVAIPEELKVENAKYYVLRNHDGEVTLLSTTLNEDGTVSFTTDQFSTYALVYAKEAPKGSPATGDNSAVMTYGVMAVAAMAVVVVLKKRESFER